MVNSARAGPLTTVFTPPPECRTANFICEQPAACSAAVDFTPNFDAASCFPSGLGAHRPNYYFSPGLCPSGWSRAVNFASKDAPSLGLPAMDADETMAACCPGGYDALLQYSSVDGLHFASSSGPGLSLARMLCSSPLHDTVTAVQCIGLGCSTYVAGPTNDSGVRRTVWEDPVVVRWHTADFPGLALETSATTGGSVPTPAPEPAQGAAGLSTGTRAGIGAGVGVAVLLAAALLIWWGLRMRWYVRRPPKGAEGLAVYSEPGLSVYADPEPTVHAQPASAGQPVDTGPEYPADPLIQANERA